MGWADQWIERLARGETVLFRPRGQSMVPRIHSGQLVTVEPVVGNEVKVQDVVLCRVGSRQYLHYCVAIQEGRYLIANARGHQNGWTPWIYGRVVSIGK